MSCLSTSLQCSQVPNPLCENIGCGQWKPRQLNNPDYRGPWEAPEVANPDYVGEWKPNQIRNPHYFVDNHPANVSLCLSLRVYISILLASCVMWSSALDSSGVLQSFPITALAQHITTILISTLLSFQLISTCRLLPWRGWRLKCGPPLLASTSTISQCATL